MNVSPASQAATPAAPTNSTPSGSEGSAGLSSDFETFLRMLTAQIRNQDPLNPMEASDFAVQLATFSGVEQQVRTNDLLGSIAGRFDLDAFARLSNWVGMEALVPGDVQFSGAPLDISTPPIEGADRAELRVTDSAGALVATLPVSPAGETIAWAGVDAQGTPLAPGRYTLSVQPYGGTEALPPQSASAYQLVTEIRNEAGKPTLLMPGGISIGADQVAALRAPSP